MGTDEIQVFEYLKSRPETYVSATEIARRVGGKARLRDEPNWIRPVLRRMLAEELLEVDRFGEYRLRIRGQNKKVPQKLTMENWQTWELVLDERENAEAATPPA